MDWGCDLLVDYCDVFIRFLDSHSDGTHSQHRNASFLNFFFWWINKRIYISDGLRANLQQFFIFEWTIPLKCQFFLKDFQAFCKLYFYFIFAVVKTTVLLADINDFNNVNDVYKQCEYE